MKTDIGKCRPLYDAAQGVADGVCDLGLDSFVSFACNVFLLEKIAVNYENTPMQYTENFSAIELEISL